MSSLVPAHARLETGGPAGRADGLPTRGVVGGHDPVGRQRPGRPRRVRRRVPAAGPTGRVRTRGSAHSSRDHHEVGQRERNVVVLVDDGERRRRRRAAGPARAPARPRPPSTDPGLGVPQVRTADETKVRAALATAATATGPATEPRAGRGRHAPRPARRAARRPGRPPRARHRSARRRAASGRQRRARLALEHGELLRHRRGVRPNARAAAAIVPRSPTSRSSRMPAHVEVPLVIRRTYGIDWTES